MSVSVAEVLAGLRSPQHRDRERSLAQLPSLVDTPTCEKTSASLESGVLALSRDSKWSARLGGLRAASVLLPLRPSAAFAASLLQAARALLEDPEVRVRWAVCELCRALARCLGVGAWLALREDVLACVWKNFDRDPAGEADHGDLSREGCPGRADEKAAPDLLGTLLARSYRVEQPGTGEMRHGAEGWRCLETAFHVLLECMEHCGDGAARNSEEETTGPAKDGTITHPTTSDAPYPFSPAWTPELHALILRAALHANRFVREAAYAGIAIAARALEPEQARAAAPDWTQRLQLGLADNWNRVRLAAVLAAEAVLVGDGEGLHAQLPQAQQPWQAELRPTVTLPPLLGLLCINRHGDAEGVRAAAQGCWERATRAEQSAGRGGGPAWLGRCAGPVAALYAEQARATNHAVREAACAAAAELAVRAEPRAAVRPHVPGLMRCLALAARDASWPVRDAAAVGAGRVAGTGLREAWAWVGRFQALWEAHLGDGVPSVREGAAQALADALGGGRALREELVVDGEEEGWSKRAMSSEGAPERKGMISTSEAASSSDPTAWGSMLGKGRRQKRSGVGPAALKGFPASPSPSPAHAPEPSPTTLLASIDAFAEKVVSILDAALDSADAQPAEPGWTLVHGGDRPVPVSADAKSERSFSWGALTPAVARGADCCVDHGYSKPPEPWERAEGGVHLARELAGLQPDAVLQRLPRIARLASLSHFAGSLALKRAVWRSLPAIARQAGLRRFKAHLELFLSDLFRGLQCGHPLTEAAAGSCAGALRDLLGPGVWEGRLSPEQREIMRRSTLVPAPMGRYAPMSGGGGVSRHAGLMAPLPPEAQLRAPRMSAGHITAPLALH